MRLRIEGHIRGEEICLEWIDGVLIGDLELAERARRLHHRTHGGPIDETDPVAVVTALEAVSPEHLHVEIVDDRDREVSSG